MGTSSDAGLAAGVTEDPGQKRRMIAGGISLLVSVILFGFKLTAYRLTGSQGVLSDALESIVNIVSAATALMVLRIAAKPADKDHPYGHGKIEFFSAAFEGGMISFAGGLIVFEAIQALIDGIELQRLSVGLIIIAGAGAVNALTGVYLRHVGRKHHSPALVASGKHLLSDFWTTAGVMAGLTAVWITGLHWLDPIVAIVVGGHLAWAGLQLLYRSGSELMDAEDRTVIETLARLFERHVRPGIIRIHHTRVVRSGRYHHVDLHLVVPEFWRVDEAHEHANRFEKQVIRDYPMEGELHFHLDPCRRAYCRTCDYPDCPVRLIPFEARVPFSLEELTSPTEPEEFADSGNAPRSGGRP